MTQRSFIDVTAESHFPIQNLPYGIFSPNASSTPRVGVAIGEYVLDLSAIEDAGLLIDANLPDNTFSQATLNPFMALGRKTWQTVRKVLQDILDADNDTLRDDEDLREQALILMEDVTLHLPVEIGDYTDFYSSREHATNVGTMFRGKDNALMPNWLHLPVAYHGRASSVVVSGTPLHRPHGQTNRDNPTTPEFTTSRNMDFELEMGFFIGPNNEHGDPINVNNAMEHIFGMVLVNDWSARDIQKWEYQPLGPFLAKNLGTSISPWVVTMDALEPFRAPSPAQDPEPLPYLQGEANRAYDIHLEVHLQSETMPTPMVIAKSNFKHMYWTVTQQLAHHTITGCNMRTGDLLASGTISGPTEDSYGSLLELTWRGTKPIQLPNGEERRFLEDNDTLTITGWCDGDGYRVGFGEVSGQLLPAKTLKF